VPVPPLFTKFSDRFLVVNPPRRTFGFPQQPWANAHRPIFVPDHCYLVTGEDNLEPQTNAASLSQILELTTCTD